MERVCLISGCQDAVAAMLRYVMEKMLEKPEQSISPDGRGSFERQKQVKILVPNSTAGMIIGKKGSKIKELSDLSGSFIQISQKPKPDEPVLSERCVIVRGNLEENIVAMNLILDIIAQDPQSGSCTQTVYKATQPVPSLFPTGSAYSDPLNLGLPSPISQNDMTAALLAMTLPGIDNSLSHPFTASSLLSLMPTGLMTTPVTSVPSQASGSLVYQQANLAQQQMLSAMLQGSGSTSPQNLLASNSSTNALLSQLFVPGSADALGMAGSLLPSSASTSGHDYEDCFKIPSSAAGAIFGHQGATINEIQARTETKIRICDRVNESHGERQVFIRGSNQINVAKAKEEILAKISGLGSEQRRGGYAQLTNLLDASAFNNQF